jgi:hypothetical protein
VTDYSSEIAERFDTVRSDFRLSADALLGYLCDVALNAPDAPLHEDDYMGLDFLEQTEGYAKGLYEPLVALDGTYGRLEDFEQRWSDFQAALPLSKPEFVWFVNIPNLKSTDTIAQLEQKIGYQVGTIVSGGIHKVVSGRELLTRWVSWRREASQFAGQGTLDMARDALAELVGIVTPGQPLPESYRTLRG